MSKKHWLDIELGEVITAEMGKAYLVETEGHGNDAEERHYENTEAGEEYRQMLIANKYVEENWESIKKDKAFMKQVKALCIEQTAPKVTDLLVKQVSEALGLERNTG